jgi:hypothetical protein
MLRHALCVVHVIQRTAPVLRRTRALQFGSRRWFHSCIVRPTIGRPRRCKTAATVDESTPPDMATATSQGCIEALQSAGRLVVSIYPLRIYDHSTGSGCFSPKPSSLQTRSWFSDC